MNSSLGLGGLLNHSQDVFLVATLQSKEVPTKGLLEVRQPPVADRPAPPNTTAAIARLPTAAMPPPSSAESAATRPPRPKAHNAATTLTAA